MRPHPLIALTALAALAAANLAGAGDIYCNNQGKECSDRPSPGAIVVHQAPTPNQNPQPASAERPPPATDAAANERLREAGRVAAVQKDVGSVREKQCKDATERYQKAVEARRMYRLTKEGEREYFTDQELDAARVSAHSDMEQACGKSG
jgi:hypothetical protein